MEKRNKNIILFSIFELDKAIWFLFCKGNVLALPVETSRAYAKPHVFLLINMYVILVIASPLHFLSKIPVRYHYIGLIVLLQVHDFIHDLSRKVKQLFMI